MQLNYSDKALDYTEAQIENITNELQEIVDRRHGGDEWQHWTIAHRDANNEDGCEPGWYAMPEESRCFNDFGEYLGHTKEIATKEIHLLMNDQE